MPGALRSASQFPSSDITVCLNVGSFYIWIARHLYSFQPRQVLISNRQHSLCIGMLWAISASIVRPADKILSICDDGGFLFSSMEQQTAARLKINIVHMVWFEGT